MPMRRMLAMAILAMTAAVAHAAPVFLGLGGLEPVEAPGGRKGLKVGEVQDGGPAQKGGLRPGDVVVSADGEPTPDVAKLGKLMKRKQPGDAMAFTVLRKGKEEVLTVTLGEKALGIAGQPAPAWKVAHWDQLPEGKASLDVADFRGKVIYLFCFQSWCPGCHKRGFPLLQRLVERYRADGRVVFVAIQTVFEGFERNTPEKGLAAARKFGLSIPVGHDGSGGVTSRLMADYRAGGTPWTVIIGPDGTVKENAFMPEEADAVRTIDALLAAAP